MLHVDCAESQSVMSTARFCNFSYAESDLRRLNGQEDEVKPLDRQVGEPF